MHNFLFYLFAFFSLVGVASSVLCIYLIMLTKGVEDVRSAVSNALATVKTSIHLFLLSGLMRCFLSKSENVFESMHRIASAYHVVALSWLVVWIACNAINISGWIRKKRGGEVSEYLHECIWRLWVFSAIGSFLGFLMSFVLG